MVSGALVTPKPCRKYILLEKLLLSKYATKHHCRKKWPGENKRFEKINLTSRPVQSKSMFYVLQKVYLENYKYCVWRNISLHWRQVSSSSWNMLQKMGKIATRYSLVEYHTELVIFNCSQVSTPRTHGYYRIICNTSISFPCETSRS